MNDYRAAIYEAEEFMGGPATPREGTMQITGPDQKGLNAARQVAQWHLGDPNWADRIIGAYINPETGLDRLREEKGGGMNKTITGTIASIDRQQNTPAGNPRWSVRVNGKTYNTKDDTACAHIPDFWDAMSRVTLTLDGNNQIIGYELD